MLSQLDSAKLLIDIFGNEAFLVEGLLIPLREALSHWCFLKPLVIKVLDSLLLVAKIFIEIHLERLCPECSATVVEQFPICKLKWDLLRTSVTDGTIDKNTFSAPFGIFCVRTENWKIIFQKQSYRTPHGVLLIFKLPFPNGSYRNGVCRALWAVSEMRATGTLPRCIDIHIWDKRIIILINSRPPSTQLETKASCRLLKRDFTTDTFTIFTQ